MSNGPLPPFWKKVLELWTKKQEKEIKDYSRGSAAVTDTIWPFFKDQGSAILNVAERSPEAMKFFAGGTALGMTDPFGMFVSVDETLGPEEREHTLVHELFHTVQDTDSPIFKAIKKAIPEDEKWVIRQSTSVPRQIGLKIGAPLFSYFTGRDYGSGDPVDMVVHERAAYLFEELMNQLRYPAARTDDNVPPWLPAWYGTYDIKKVPGYEEAVKMLFSHPLFERHPRRKDFE